jgi:DNA end-binding protein Ku
MTQAIWKGWLSFGLVSIPVRLYRAVEEKTVRFREIDRASGRAVRHRRVVEPAAGPRPAEVSREEPDAGPEAVPATDQAEDVPVMASASQPRRDDVSYDDVVKGYELPSGEMVTVDRDALAALAPEQTRTIDIVEFVDLSEIDPIFFDRSYYVVPQDEAQAGRAYGLLVRAMEKTGRVAVGSFVLRTREHLASIRPVQGTLCLVTLHYADEIRSPREVGGRAGGGEAPAREVRLAEQLIDALSATWDPTRHRDAYRERVLQLIAERANAGDLLPAPAKDDDTVAAPIDLMAALKASVEAIAAEGKPQRSRRKTG